LSPSAGSHRYVTIPKGSVHKRKRGQTKSVRIGSRNPGNANGHGSIRRPF